MSAPHWSKKQEEFIDFGRNPDRYGQGAIALAMGSVRSGKTFACVYAFLAYSQDAPEESSHLVLGPNLKTLKNNVFRPMSQAHGKASNYQGKRLAWNNGDVEWGGQRYRFCAGTESDICDQFQGETVYALFVDEAVLIHEETWLEAMNRLSYDESRVWATCNPGGTRHFLKKDWIDQGKIALYDIFYLDDNPWLTEPVKQGLRDRAANTGVNERRKIFAEWADSEGLVYQTRYFVNFRGHFEMDERALTVPFKPRKIIFGLDYGNTDTCTLVPLLEFSDALAMNFPEVPSTTLSKILVLPPIKLNEEGFDNRDMLKRASDYVRQVAGRRRCRIYCDPSAYLALNKSLKRMRPRLPNISLRAANNDRAVGITSTMSLLGSGEMAIDDRADVLADEMAGYEFDDHATDDFDTLGEDHYCDGLRYGVMGLLGLLSPIPTIAQI